MYVGTYLDKKNNKLWVSERIKGQRLTTEYPLILEYYLADENGYYNGLDGKKLKKVTYRNSFEQYQLKQQYEENHIQTYELNFNLTNKVLYKYYNGAKSPELHKSFFDIEVDRKGYEYLTVDQLIEKACCPINAISIYNNWQDTLFTLMLKPETLSKEQALEVCKKFENTFLFDDEKGLLEALLVLFNDSDILCGWNSCLEKNTPIWLKNRIIPFYKINEGDKLCDSIVQKKSNINLKDEYCITLYNGMKIYTSKDHIFPNIEYDNEKYVYNKNMGSNIKDNNVEYLINTIKDKTLFLKLKKHINENKSITYRDYILICLDYILKYYDICFSNMDIKIDWNKSRTKQKCYSRIKDKITKEDIVKYIKENDSLKIFNKGFSGNFEIDLNEIINDDYMHILGLIYTDGSKWKNTISFYNSNISVINRITMFTDEIKQVDKEKTNPYYNYKGVMRRRFSINNKLGFLIGMIYDNDNKKSLNKEILSLCSEQQFFSFFSGCIDGDGWIGKNNVGYCNYDNNILDVQELLLWNGIFSSTQQYDKHLAIPAYLNSLMKEKLNLWVDYKVEKLKNLKNVSRKNSKAKARLTYHREYEDNIYVQIKSIKSTNRKVEMYDIMTDTHYFYANGVKTHNCRFDIPYIVRRLNNILGKKSANRLNVWDVEPKEKSAKDDFGSTHIEYELYGKWNVDYLVLYKKHERGKKESYKLDAIAEIELGENKVQHDESLEDMYRNRYEDFIKYNRQDTMLVKRLEDKLKYIDIHNVQCHTICCTYDATLGTVGWCDQCFINKSHELNMIVPDKNIFKGKEYLGVTPAGAHVPSPIIGLHENIMSYDMHAMYPSSARTVNMSPETIIAQVRLTKTLPFLWKRIEDNELYSNKSKKIPSWGDAWSDIWGSLEYQDIIAQNDEKLILDIEGGNSIEMTAKQIYDMIFKEGSNMSISGFGTIFRTDIDGIIPIVFTQWDEERSIYKEKKSYYKDLYNGIKIEDKELLNKLKEI